MSYQLQSTLQLTGNDFMLTAPTYWDVPGVDYSGPSYTHSSQPYHYYQTPQATPTTLASLGIPAVYLSPLGPAAYQ